MFRLGDQMLWEPCRSSASLEDLNSILRQIASPPPSTYKLWLEVRHCKYASLLSHLRFFFFAWNRLAARITLIIHHLSLFDHLKKIFAEIVSCCAGGFSDVCACFLAAGKRSDPTLQRLMQVAKQWMSVLEKHINLSLCNCASVQIK